MLFLLVGKVFGKERAWTIIYDPLFHLIARQKLIYFSKEFRFGAQLLQMWFTDCEPYKAYCSKTAQQVCNKLFSFAFNEVMVFNTYFYLQIQFSLGSSEEKNKSSYGVVRAKVKLVRIITI